MINSLAALATGIPLGMPCAIEPWVLFRLLFACGGSNLVSSSVLGIYLQSNTVKPSKRGEQTSLSHYKGMCIEREGMQLLRYQSN